MTRLNITSAPSYYEYWCNKGDTMSFKKTGKTTTIGVMEPSKEEDKAEAKKNTSSDKSDKESK